MKHSIYRKQNLNIILGILLLFLIWEIIHVFYQNDLVFPSLLELLNSFKNMIISPNTYQLLLGTIIRIIGSLLLGIIISFGITTLYCVVPSSLSLFKPFLVFMKATPLIIISLFVWLLLGANFGPYFINLLIIVPIMTEGLISGINQIDSNIIDSLRLEVDNKLRVIFEVKFLMIKDQTLMILLQTIGLSFKVMVMAEYICQTNKSIGKTLINLKNALEVADLLAWAILIMLVVVITETFLQIIKKKLEL